MIKNLMTSPQTGFGLPVSGTAVASAAAVRTLPTVGGVSVIAAAWGKGLSADVAPVRAYALTDAVVEGTFPGTSAWSPPI
ncbi:MAG: hypothetical protein LOY01_12980 [Brachybacterium paraconglomeratum]|nr:hypothetical protein [Brachybacterium paraconglomeratum]